MSANKKRLPVVCCVGVLLALAASPTAVADPSQAHVSVHLDGAAPTNVTNLQVISSVSEAYASGWQGINVYGSDPQNGQAVTRTSASAVTPGASGQAETKSFHASADAQTSYGGAYGGAPGVSPGSYGPSQRWAFTSVTVAPVTFTFDLSYAMDLQTTVPGERASGVLWVGVNLRDSGNASNANWFYLYLDPAVQDGADFSESVSHQSISVTTPFPVWPGFVGDLTITVYAAAALTVSPGPIPAAVDHLARASLGSTRYDRGTNQTGVRTTITNTSQTPIGGPVWIVIESISDPGVNLAGSSGTTAEGDPYVDVTALLRDNRLDPREKITPQLSFDNPQRRQFTFTYSIRGVVPPG